MNAVKGHAPSKVCLCPSWVSGGLGWGASLLTWSHAHWCLPNGHLSLLLKPVHIIHPSVSTSSFCLAWLHVLISFGLLSVFSSRSDVLFKKATPFIPPFSSGGSQAYQGTMLAVSLPTQTAEGPDRPLTAWLLVPTSFPSHLEGAGSSYWSEQLFFFLFSLFAFPSQSLAAFFSH